MGFEERLLCEPAAQLSLDSAAVNSHGTLLEGLSTLWILDIQLSHQWFPRVLSGVFVKWTLFGRSVLSDVGSSRANLVPSSPPAMVVSRGTRKQIDRANEVPAESVRMRLSTMEVILNLVTAETSPQVATNVSLHLYKCVVIILIIIVVGFGTLAL